MKITSVDFIYIIERDKLCLYQNLNHKRFYGNQTNSGVLCKLHFQTQPSVGFIYITEKEKLCLGQDLNCKGFYGNQTYSGVLWKLRFQT